MIIIEISPYAFSFGRGYNEMYRFFFFRYDPKENKWTRVASMSTRRLGVAVAVLGGFLYAVGGSDGTSPLNTGKYRKM